MDEVRMQVASVVSHIGEPTGGTRVFDIKVSYWYSEATPQPRDIPHDVRLVLLEWLTRDSESGYSIYRMMDEIYALRESFLAPPATAPATAVATGIDTVPDGDTDA